MDNIPINPQMTKAEIRLLDSIIQRSNNMIEFGSGGSTFHIMRHHTTNLTSIDTDYKFIASLISHTELKQYLKIGRLRLLHVDIGPTGPWGYPITPDTLSIIKNILTDFWDGISSDFDTSLIDGRYRLYIALRMLIKCPTATHIFHDFNTRRQYHQLLNFIDIIEMIDSLIIYKSKPYLNYDDIISALMNSIFDPT